ncbi:MAG: nuclear transport factor 2 family protein [Actinomycetota bacterium]
MASNAELLTLAYDALSEGNADPVLALYEPDAVLHSPGGGPFSEARTVAQFRDALDRLQRAGDRSYRIRAHAILTDDEHAIVLEEHESSLGATRAVAVFHMVGGRIRERWFYPEDQEVSDPDSRPVVDRRRSMPQEPRGPEV